MKKNILASMFLVLVILLSACGAAKPTVESPKQAPMLGITVTVSPDAGYSFIPANEISEAFPVNIQCNNLTDILIHIDGSQISLEDAFRQELIHPEEIFAYAQIDARNGLCDLHFESQNGLTYFIFTYPKFDLAIVNDVMETPSGKQHLIQTMNFDMAYRYEIGDILYTENDSIDALDREDWGLTFETLQNSDSSITLSCTQSDGQQIGQLQIYDYLLFSTDSNGLTPSSGAFTPQEIQMDGTSTFSLDWSEAVGLLPAGNYILRLYITDIYDQSQVHPLMQNYYDSQKYDIPFTVSST